MHEILVVDDEQRVLEATQEALEHNGYKVLGVPNPLEAYKLVRTNPERFALILLDWWFPAQVHGDLLIQLIQHYLPAFKTPIIVISSHTSLITKHVMRLGAYDTLAKPLDDTQLIEAVERALNKRPPEDPYRRVPQAMGWKEVKRLQLAVTVVDALASTASLAEAARYLGCSTITLNRWLHHTGLAAFVHVEERKSNAKDTR